MNEKLAPFVQMSQRSNLSRHWLVFASAFFFGLVVCAGIQQSWSEGLGAILIPTAIGYFVVKGGRNVSGLLVRYSIFMVGFMFAISALVISEITEAHNSTQTSCLARNTYTAQLTTEKRTEYCRCMSDKLDAAIVWSTSTSFLAFKPLTRKIQDVPELMVLATKRANECAVQMGG
ncbi:hypothetical protein [Sinorhizobium meliloti]|uniref:Hypothetical transmembrane protein n=1 Tax=Rhizobium meliloti (strain 1021) TaxID=266834 RepID=Q92SB4_RHIME|nr:hypothetical protein [Sinorhizobium meliloti]AGG73076.1 putative transmembrane protein [Sinorhizobium meliloti 2011]ASP60026.1 hypothetical protein CDO30_05485 [Sinorhizobium meliloti]MCK3802814.1 hypothetical protein [Sinorhizobium meliloti]MCK3808666.1 hypothetical protein [Sinorhizobium meliloti]MCK3813435.1 hypothetical protein [Sinorhizobium meliloti]